MTLLDVERLVRRILDALQQPDGAGLGPKLAEDFAAACHATNLRLQQCEAMLRAGDRHQAIQAAETSPNLLDCVTALEFRSADQWRAYCQQHGLAVADRVDGRAVQALNQCYSQGIATDHPLYGAYRKATLSRNDEEALRALQSITRLNPADTNAAAEMTRLDAKVLQARLHHLEETLIGSPADVIVIEVEAIEALGLRTRPAGDPWMKGQVVRCGVMLELARNLREARKWEEMLAKVDLIRRLEAEHGLTLPADLRRGVAELEHWGHHEEEKDRRNREFETLLARLRFLVQQSEEKDISARRVKLPEMREDYEALNKIWRALGDFERTIPEDATTAFQKRSALLESEIARRASLGRRGVIAGVIALLALGAAAGWLGLAQMKAHDLATQMRAAAAQRKVRTAERLLESAKAFNNPISSSILSAPVSEAGTFVAKEENLLRNFDEALGKLPKDLGGRRSGDELFPISGQLALARDSLGALAPDLRAEREPMLRGFEDKWGRFLADNSVTFNQVIEQAIAAAEKQRAGLDYRLGNQAAKYQLGLLSKQLNLIAECEAGITNLVKIRADLLARGARVAAAFAAFDEQVAKFDKGSSDMRRAGTAGSFLAALRLIASSEFSGEPLTKAAEAVMAVGPSEENALRFLLGATNGGTWAFVKKDGPVRFIPEVAFPAETRIFHDLNEDPAVSRPCMRVRLWLDEKGARPLEWITVGRFAESTGWATITAYEVSPASERCAFLPQEYGYFDGKYKLSRTRTIERLEFVGLAVETAGFGRLGLGNAAAGSGYGKPLLESLDSLKGTNGGSPLFQAYLFLRLGEVMALQPDAWGLTFSPALQAHLRAVSEVTQERLASGDWFVPHKVELWSAPIQNILSIARTTSYSKQALGLATLAREAAGGGFRYAGFIDLEGRPVLLDAPAPRELWGYSSQEKQPALITSAEAAGQKGMPLSPLFSLSAPRAEILNRAGVDPEGPVFKGVLPPLFLPAHAKPAQR